MNLRSTPTHALMNTAYEAPDLARALPRDHTGPRRLLRPLTLILALQAGLSLSLVWSNTAFGDEGEYLWAGHLEIAHWLHGVQIPAVLPKIFSGSPVIYPPIGAMADSVGGLAGARLLSLVFMLITTILLYSSVKQLLGEPAAILSAALWAISEPAIRLGAYATYDAMSVFMTALSAWLALRAVRGSRHGFYIAASAAALALANATAYSGVSIDPIVVSFAFFAWIAALGFRRAVILAAWFVLAMAAFFAGLLIISGSWTGIMYTVFLRGQAGGYTSGSSTVGFIVKNVWVYEGLYLILCLISVVAMILAESGIHRLLLGTSAAAVLVVPVAQLHDLTEVSLDKHLAYGIWFGAIACGYVCERLIRSVPGMRVMTVVVCSGLALAYPALGAWQAALAMQQSWANATDFVAAFRPAVSNVSGPIYASTEDWLARYYTPQGFDWTRWNVSNLPLSLPSVPAKAQVAEYSHLLSRFSYGVICLFYETTIHGVPANMVLSPGSDTARVRFLNFVTASNSTDSDSAIGKAALTIALEEDPSYRLASVGPYSSDIQNGIYAIWEKVAP